MTQIQRNAAIDALSDILLARAASRHKGGGDSGMSGMSGTIKVDPRLNKPEPTGGGGGKMQVNDPQGILSQRNKTTVAMPDASTNTQNDQQDTGTQQPTNGTNSTSADQNQTSDATNTGSADGSSASSETSDAEKEQKSTEQNTQTKQTNSDARSADYRNAWNNIITRFDRDDISKDQLLELIARIQGGELEI